MLWQFHAHIIRHMSESEKHDSRFWQIFVTLLVLFGMISIISRTYAIEWYYTWGAAIVTTVIVVVVFQRFIRREP